MKPRKKKKRKKFSLKRTAETIARRIYKQLVELPEEERERDIAMFERAVAKKFKKLTRKKK